MYKLTKSFLSEENNSELDNKSRSKKHQSNVRC